jgi:hypothetical protein
MRDLTGVGDTVTLVMHTLLVLFTPVGSRLTELLKPPSNKPKILPNFASVINTSNISFTGVNDPGDACIDGAVGTGDAPLEHFTVRQ